MHGEISRRELIKAALAAGLTVVGATGCDSGDDQLVSRGPGQPVGTPVVKNPDGTGTVAGGGKLAKGTAIMVTLPDQRPVLLFKTKSGAMQALSALCTHNQCTVAWDGSSGTLKCPCHGSIFDASGKPQKGPAEKPLEKFKVQVKGDDAVLQLKS